MDGQVNLKIAVYQGERDLVSQNRKLGEFPLTGLPAMPAGLPKVDVNFLLNADGILQVTAREQRSGLTRCDFEQATLDTWIGAVEGLDEPVRDDLREFDCRNHRLAQLGLDQPRAVVRNAYEAQKAKRW